MVQTMQLVYPKNYILWIWLTINFIQGRKASKLEKISLSKRNFTKRRSGQNFEELEAAEHLKLRTSKNWPAASNGGAHVSRWRLLAAINACRPLEQPKNANSFN